MTNAPIIRVLNFIAQKLILLLGIVCFGFVSYHACRYIYAFKSYSEEYVEAYFDAPGKGLLALMITLIGMLFCVVPVRRSALLEKGVERILLPALMGISFFAAIYWVHISHSMPYNDQLYLTICAGEFAQGNFEQLSAGGYAGYYPHQLPLILVLEVLFRLLHTTSYLVVQYLNAILLPLMILGGYLAVKAMFRETGVAFVYLCLIMGCLPVIFYVPYVYGEIASFTFVFWEIWALCGFLQNGRVSYAIAALISSTAAFVFRKNTLIILIAVGIVLLWHAVLAKTWKPVLLLIGMILCVVLVQAFVLQFYELRSGIQIGSGIPSSAWVAMGLMDGWPGPGWFNNMNREIYQASGFDPLTADAMAKSAIAERLQVFRADPAYARAFFRCKILTQWNEPTYGAFYLNYSFSEPLQEGSFVYRVFDGDLNISLSNFMNHYQFVIYVLAVIGMVLQLFRNRKPIELLPQIALIGGFFFSLLWEAKSRYALPYLVLMVPVAAYGIEQVRAVLSLALGRYFATRPEMLDAARIDHDPSINDATLGGFDDRRDADKEQTARFYLFRRSKQSQKNNEAK
ncbi:MAG: hypothetical protein K6G23_03930 [Lachnospiraceae bacterium]|nr:hypothetical protein [Lachnospiraceae bacterium]